MLSPYVRDHLRRPPWSLIPAVLITCIAAWVFFLFNDVFLHHDFAYDESYFTWGGWCINKGLAPYRDFMEFKPPILFLTHALALKLYGFAHFQYRWFFLWFPMASVLAFQVALVSRGNDAVAVLALGLALIYMWLTPNFHDTALSDSESVGLAYYFLAVACLLGRSRFGDRLKIPGGAFLVGCALSKEPYLLGCLSTWMTCFLLERRGNVRDDAVRYIKMTGLGAGIVVAALCLYMIPTGSMKAYIQMMGGYVRMYRDPKNSYCVILGRVHPTTPWNDFLKEVDQMSREFLIMRWFQPLIPLIGVAVVFTAWRSPLLLLATTVTVLLALYAVTASNCMWFHYYLLSMGGIFFALGVGIDSLTTQLRNHRRLRLAIGLGLLAMSAYTAWPRVEAERAAHGTRTFSDPYRELVPNLHAMVDKYTTPADRIFTTGPPLTYVQMDRISATRESTIIDEGLGYYEGATDEEKLRGVRAELEKNMPKLFILDPESTPRKVRHYRALLKPFLDAHKYTEVSPYIWLRPY
jgi:hypothetical protein